MQRHVVGQSEYAVQIEGSTFTWKDPAQPVLSNINLRVRRGSLVAVVGKVGAGKSSLIEALLGNLTRIGGRVTVSGSVAYAPQQVLSPKLLFCVLTFFPFKRVSRLFTLFSHSAIPVVDELRRGSRTRRCATTSRLGGRWTRPSTTK